MSIRSGKVQTVLGMIDPGELGHTQTHEHLLVVLIPPEGRSKLPPEEPIRMETLGKLRMFKADPDELGLISNVAKLDSEADAIDEMQRYRAAGGGTVVDATSIGIGRNPRGLARISQESGVHVVMGAAYYEAAYHPQDTLKLDEAALAERIVRDVVDGVDDTGICAGLIGEIGLGWPVKPAESRVLAAGARAQRETGAPVMIHPGRFPDAPLEAVRAFEKAGGDPTRMIMAHIDRTLFSLDAMKELAATGCMIEFDLFGQESSYYPFAPIDMPNDATRIDYLAGLFDAGYGSQLVIAQDICMKTHLTRYGGESYSHILETVLPMMDRKGLGQDQIRTICVENPQRILAFE